MHLKGTVVFQLQQRQVIRETAKPNARGCNDPVKGGAVASRYVAKQLSADKQYFAMYGPGRDGAEVKMMEMVYTRR